MVALIGKRRLARHPQLQRIAPVGAVQHEAAGVGLVWWQFQQAVLYPMSWQVRTQLKTAAVASPVALHPCARPI